MFLQSSLHTNRSIHLSTYYTRLPTYLPSITHSGLGAKLNADLVSEVPEAFACPFAMDRFILIIPVDGV